MSVKVGDVLMRQPLNSRYSKPHEVVVQKVGRKWGVAKPIGGGPDYRFDLETGYEDAGQYSSNWRILSAEQMADEQRRENLKAALKEAGVEISYGIRSASVTTDQLQQIADVLGVAGDE